ncbi:biotin-dependent carboxyltransferase family protein [Tamlana sp. I1]|uniref:5-oxoprolinase subunit C family protein n=1 Tax=Tamlana sp. I1 TaxID=2762061 RepID=UPI00188E156F|nr:biotin-dependent carboxyltransferase family protein [Tamlana sp. I1]
MIKVLKPGLFTTIQDLGRFGFQEFGVPYSGAMDVYAAKMANALLGNSQNDAVLEMTMLGPTLQFNCATLICVSGADMQAKLNNKPIEAYKLVQVKADDVLSFSSVKKGFRAYLAVKGGFQTETVMQSRSMYQSITENHYLSEGDTLPIESYNNQQYNPNAALKVQHDYMGQSEIGVFKGPEFDLLTKAQQERLLSFNFKISKENNRMAYQLNEPLENTLEAIITSPVLPGTVQLTPSGKLIVLMRDCQTTGGYPRVLQLSEASISALSQKYTGQSVRFKLLVYGVRAE